MAEIITRSGRRKAKRKMESGVQRKFEGAGGTGRKGAIAVPGNKCKL